MRWPVLQQHSYVVKRAQAAAMKKSSAVKAMKGMKGMTAMK